MKAGAARADITPEPGIELSGFVAREQPSLSVHDPLLARAVAMEQDGARFVWIHADVLGFEAGTAGRIANRLGWSENEVMLSATHTHSGPPTLLLHNCGEPRERDREYLSALEPVLASVAEQAWKVREEVNVRFGQSRCDLAIDRRGKPSRHTDPVMSALDFERADGSVVAAVANYAIHPVALGPQNRQISADLFGFAASDLARALPGEPEVLFTNGACGNLNPPHRADYAQVQTWARQMADSAVLAFSRRRLAQGSLGSALKRMSVVADLDALAARKAQLREEFANSPGASGERSREALRRWEKIMDGEPPVSMELPLHAVRIAGIPFLGMGCEVFSRMTEQLRAEFGPWLQVVGYANGDFGYLCPESAYDEGGYEPCSAFVFYRTPPVRRGEFERVRLAGSDLLRQLDSTAGCG